VNFRHAHKTVPTVSDLLASDCVSIQSVFPHQSKINCLHSM